MALPFSHIPHSLGSDAVILRRRPPRANPETSLTPTRDPGLQWRPTHARGIRPAPFPAGKSAHDRRVPLGDRPERKQNSRGRKMKHPSNRELFEYWNERRRRHQRVRVNLLGRYMLADRRKFPCQVVNMSPGGIALIAPVAGNVGDRVIAYVDHLGRLEGHLARLLQNGFAMTILATPRKRDMLAAQLTWLANRSILNLPEDRRHGRFVPKVASARLIMPNGTNIGVRIIDISLSGAGISHGRTPRDRRPRHDRQDPRPRGAPFGSRLRDRVHEAAASGLGRRERDRTVNAAFHGFCRPPTFRAVKPASRHPPASPPSLRWVLTAARLWHAVHGAACRRMLKDTILFN